MKIYLPTCRYDYDQCGVLGRRARCNRLKGHTGWHMFYLRHIDGLVREVWE